MIRTTIEDYGGVKVDGTPIRNPTSELAASHLNRATENVAQLTGSPCRAVVRFKLSAAATVDPADVFVRSHWGSGDAAKPVITRQSSAKYTLTWAATYTDALGYVETPDFFDAHAQATIRSGVVDPMLAEAWYASGNVVKIYVADPATSAVLPADVSPGTAAAVYATVWVY